jgi:hypothetical protein
MRTVQSLLNFREHLVEARRVFGVGRTDERGKLIRQAAV